MGFDTYSAEVRGQCRLCDLNAASLLLQKTRTTQGPRCPAGDGTGSGLARGTVGLLQLSMLKQAHTSPFGKQKEYI
jgi:hypothetical protein